MQQLPPFPDNDPGPDQPSDPAQPSEAPPESPAAMPNISAVADDPGTEAPNAPISPIG